MSDTDQSTDRSDLSISAITRPGIYTMPQFDYFADPVPGGSLSQSGAKLLLQSPALFDYQRKHPTPPTEAMKFGTAAHSVLLEMNIGVDMIPDDVLGKGGAKSTKAAREFITASEAAGQVAVTPAEWDVLQAMREAVEDHPAAGPLLEAGKPEQSYFWQDQGVWRRSRIDFTTYNGTVVDYKTARSAEPGEFAKAVYNLGYHMQAAWYLDAVAALDIAPAERFVFIVQEKTAPYLVAVYELDADALALGDLRNRQAIDLYRQCAESGVWPGYSDRIQTLSLPRWAR